MNNLGLYIHIPFCRSKCPYCDFFSVRGNEKDYSEYVKVLNNNIKYWSEKTAKPVDTIYFGGGTPSALGADNICEILSCVKDNFNITKDAEITLEANPSRLIPFDYEKVSSLGVNRISLGLQSADENELKTLGRLHSAEDVKNTVQQIRNAGIDNISLDLMMSIPRQTADSLKKSIDFCVTLDVQHISSYILKIESGTVFDKRYDNYDFPDDDETAELYLFAVDYLAENGFEQYEISNFSKKGFESRHNLKYWTLEDYLGIGPAAHSFMDGKRFYYDRSFEAFRDNKLVFEGSGGGNDEYIMLGLRLKKGIDLEECKKALGEDLTESLLKKSAKYIKSGYMKLSNGKISFTPKGFLVSNTIISDLI